METLLLCLAIAFLIWFAFLVFCWIVMPKPQPPEPPRHYVNFLADALPSNGGLSGLISFETNFQREPSFFLNHPMLRSVPISRMYPVSITEAVGELGQPVFIYEFQVFYGLKTPERVNWQREGF